MDARKTEDIFSAIKDRDKDALKAFLDSEVDLSVTNKDEQTPIQYACELNFWDLVDKIAKYTTDEDDKFCFGDTLFEAVRNGYFRSVRILLDALANTEWHTADLLGDGICHMAARRKDIKTLKVLLDPKYRARIDYTALNLKQQTPLQIACLQGAWDCVREIVSAHLLDLQSDNLYNLDWNEEWNATEKGWENVTIAWIFAYYQQWELLWQMGQHYVVNLTAKPTVKLGKDQQPDERAQWDIACMLVKAEKWQMLHDFAFKSCAADFSQLKVLLTSTCDKQTIFDVWLKEDETTLFRLLRNCDKGTLVSLRAVMTENGLLADMGAIAYARAMLDEIAVSIHNHALLDQKDQADLIKNVEAMFESLCRVNGESEFYKDAQLEIADIILSTILPCPLLHQSSAAYLNRQLKLNRSEFSGLSDGEMALRGIVMHCYARADATHQMQNIYLESFSLAKKLKTENAELKHENEALKRGLKRQGELPSDEVQPATKVQKNDQGLFTSRRRQPARSSTVATQGTATPPEAIVVKSEPRS